MPKKLKRYRLATESEIKEALKAPEGISEYKIGEAIFSFAPGGVPKNIAFKIMVDTFGSPNGTAGKDSVWQWVIKSPAGLLTVYDFQASWSIGVLGIDVEINSDLNNHASILRDWILEEASKTKFSKKLIEELKLGGNILNPYALYRRTTNHLLNQAESTATTERLLKGLELKGTLGNLIDTSRTYEIMSSYYRGAFITSLLSLEGFVNLIYLLFLKEKYRNKFYLSRLQNEFLPIKILDIDTYCSSFESTPVSLTDELFKAIQHLVNVRNSILHANISEAMESHLIRYKKHFVFTEISDDEKFGISSNLKDISEKHIIRASKLVRKLVISVIRSMDIGTRYPFAIVHTQPWVAYFRIKDEDKTLIFVPEGISVNNEDVDTFLSESTALDKRYYDVSEEDFRIFTDIS
jgi:hypothetical protein